MNPEKDALDCTAANLFAKEYAERVLKSVDVDHSRTEPFTGTELASFMIMLFRVATPSGGSEGSFDDQLCRIANAVSGTPGPLRDRVGLIVAMSRDRDIRPLIDRTHAALLELFTAVHETGEWGDCRLMSMEQFFKIADL